LQVLGYTNFLRWNSVALGGGAITDSRSLRRLRAADRHSIAEHGGVYFQLLRFAVDALRDTCEGLFGYCGNPLAEAIDLRVGFAKTDHTHLLALFPDSTGSQRQKELIDSVAALGPF
jgi:hypothetical protein